MPGLFGSTFIEVAIGLAFVYFLLSLICSSINEILSGFLKLRARDLERGVENLLCDPDIAKQVIHHPLIQGLGNTRAETPPVKLGAGEGAEPTPGEAPKKRGFIKRGWHSVFGVRKDFAGKPSYIPARAFTSALIDSLVPGPGQSATAADIIQKAKELAGDTEKLTTDLLPTEKLGRALLGLAPDGLEANKVLLSVDDIKDLVDRQSHSDFDEPLKSEVAAAKSVDAIRRKIAALPQSDAQKAVFSAIADGQTAVTEFRKSFEAWFDDAMERVSGVYKRRTQFWLLWISLLVTVFVGADTLRIYHALANNPVLRTELANQAQRETGESGSLNLTFTPTESASATSTPESTPVSTEAAAATTDDENAEATPTPTLTPTPTAVVPTTREILNELDETALPFGYDDRPWATGANSGFWGSAWWVLGRIGGILLTTFAVSLGAPFWFDVLKRFSNLRSAGPSPGRN